jgi:hypothetical protein
VDLLSGTLDRELEVPSVVVATGTPAQRDAATAESQVLGVEVVGLELESVRSADGRDIGQIGERRHRGGVLDVVLVLDLSLSGSHH